MMLAELYRLRDWLKAHNCQMVAMESTGVYWKPIWNVLEEELALMLVNAQHIKAVPGTKNGHQGCGVDRRTVRSMGCCAPVSCRRARSWGFALTLAQREFRLDGATA